MEEAVKIFNTSSFSMQIEKIACGLKISYMDAVVHYCDKHDMEIEVAATSGCWSSTHAQLKETILCVAISLLCMLISRMVLYRM